MKRGKGDVHEDNEMVDHATVSKKKPRFGTDHDDMSDPLFERLPDELILHILVLTDDVGALAAWSLTSRRHHALAADQSLWRHLCTVHYGPPLHEPPWPEGVDWRWIYRAQSHPACPEGADVGAVWVKCGRRVYWGDVVDRKPRGFGVMLDTHSVHHCDAQRLRVDTTGTSHVQMTSGRRRQGHWIHGKMHGDGTKVYSDGTTFKGRWEDGHRPLVGTLRFPCGGHYDGECKSHTPHGHGTYIYASGEKREGQWDRGRACGDGTETYDNGDVFVGKWTGGGPYDGTYIWANGRRYDGEFNSKGQSHGHGSIVYANGGHYDGQWFDDHRQGHGVMTYADGTRYEGQWDNGKRHGPGVAVCADGSRYEGEWHNDHRQGDGVMVYADGTRYQGWWHKGRPRGHGTMVYSNGDRYEGQWRDGERHGHGVMVYANGDRYEGQWRDALFHGRGVLAYANGERYEGEWDSDRRHGHGVYTWPSGDEYRGTYAKSRRRGQGTKTFADGSRLSGVWEGTLCTEKKVETHRLAPPCSPDAPCLACAAQSAQGPV
ncbi:Morn repeat domain containing protein [Pandoravirus quercus]|uniref:Morn repeat domain containing protein n=1 Tax=Pandoravirus quercus TaxID=2107709 RepID=A0A2U7U9Y2_9VIRU|nr:Morn repeat domain containing protein [Pandoravirus quercus]AVK75195.1 Morn repeat domain containing protein [Pandoravirus quercus]